MATPRARRPPRPRARAPASATATEATASLGLERDGATHARRSSSVDFKELLDTASHYATHFGRHDAYAGGEQGRPLMRGWVHFACLVSALTGRGLGYHARVPEEAVLFIQCTLLTYALSVCLHMVPWKTRLGYDVALALDFIGISWGFTSHTILWTKGIHSFSQWGAVITFGLMVAMQVAAFTQKSKRVLMFMRRRRMTLILLNIVFLGVVEWRAIQDFKTMLLIQVLSKIVSPLYFVMCARFDANHKPFLAIPGVWGPHENWHVMILVVHLLQLRALVAQNS